MTKTLIPITPGDRYGHWTVLREGTPRQVGDEHDQRARRVCVCECDCGSVREVLLSDLHIERSLSCGCSPRVRPLRRPVFKQAPTEAQQRYADAFGSRLRDRERRREERVVLAIDRLIDDMRTAAALARLKETGELGTGT